MMLDVCVCTHDPDLEKLEKTFQALAAQTAPRGSFQVTVVDNASRWPIEKSNPIFRGLRDAGISFRVLREEKVGVAHARVLAFKETGGNVLFVDDDNYLAPDFVAEALRILEQSTEVGVFSGKMLLPKETKVPQWLKPWLLAMAIKDIGDHPVVDWYYGYWQPWVPVATASMVVRRSVIEKFLKTYALDPHFFRLGRNGKFSFASGEDAVIAKTASDVQLKCGYFPNLVMIHDVNPKRFRFLYVLRLKLGFGLSDYWQFRVGRIAPLPFTLKVFSSMIRPLWDWSTAMDLRIRLVHIAWAFTAVFSWIRLHLAQKQQPVILPSS
ncbi:MAG: glycosyltransferase [Bdellovibrionales bacterium]|nr:glycosyltransferase [Bdellovibrionales bacterium]